MTSIRVTMEGFAERGVYTGSSVDQKGCSNLPSCFAMLCKGQGALCKAVALSLQVHSMAHSYNRPDPAAAHEHRSDADVPPKAGHAGHGLHHCIVAECKLSRAQEGQCHRAAAYLEAGEGCQAGLGSPVGIRGAWPGLCVAALAG